MKTWSIPIGRIFGIEVRLHLTFLFLLVFVWFTESAAPSPDGAARGLQLLGIVFGSVVLHELGHALASTHSSVPVRAIVLLPIGGVTIAEDPFAFDAAEPEASADSPPKPALPRWQRE